MAEQNESVESMENRRKRLKFRAWHRGTREMDLVMGSFADRNLENFGAKELEEFENLLTCSDPDVYDWILGRKPVPEEYRSGVMDRLLRHRLGENEAT